MSNSTSVNSAPGSPKKTSETFTSAPSQKKKSSSLHQDAFKAAGRRSATVHGANILAPVIPDKPSGLLQQLSQGHPNSDTLPATDADGIPANFVLSGKIELFDQGLTVDFYSYHGPTPEDATLQAGEAPVYQMAALDPGHKLFLSKLLPEFAGTTFDKIGLTNVTFTYQNTIIDKKKGLGFTIDADVVFDKSHGQVHQVLTNFLGISDPTLRLSCALGVQDWHKPLSLSSFQLEGLFKDPKPDPAIKKMKIISIGVRLTGAHGVAHDAAGGISQSKTCYSYSIFGDLNLDFLPTPVAFVISDLDDLVPLNLTLGGEWPHAFGISQLTLEQLDFSTTFELNNIQSNLVFDVKATMHIGSSAISFSGKYSLDGSYSLDATFSKLNFSYFTGIFSHLYTVNLVEPSFDLEIDSASLNISNGSFTFDIHQLRVGEHVAQKVVVEHGSGGVVFDVTFDNQISYKCRDHPVDIDEAHAKITFVPERKNDDGSVTKGSTDILISGTLDWESHKKMSASLYLERSPDGTLDYTVVAQFASSDGLILSHIIPGLENTFLKDITLQSAGLAITSRSDLQLGALGVPCQINQGFQVYAVLGKVTQMEKILGVPKQDHPQELTLCAAWEKGFSSKVDVFRPTPHISLGRGIVVDDVSLEITLDKNPHFSIKGGAKIPVNHQPSPLDFFLVLTIGLESAEVEGTLTCKDGWNDPFGISDKLTIDTVSLDVGIIYETFLETGPNKVGFKGTFLIDGIKADVAFVVDEIPSNELLYAKMDQLTLSNVVDLTNSILDVKMPKPPNVVIFETISICLSPTGATYDDKTYPPGFSFSADLVLFGIKADAFVSINKSGFQCSGSVDAFSLGFLHVSGTTPGQPAKLALCLTEDRQYGMIDGSITIFGVQSQIKLNFEMHPHLTFDFVFSLQFAGLFDFQVQASKAVAVSATNPNATEGDYTLKAEFHQEIRTHVAEKIDALFKEKARLESQEASVIKKELDEAKKQWETNLAAKDAALKQALDKKNLKIAQKTAKINKDLEGQKTTALARQKAFDDAQAVMRKDVADAKAKFAADTAKATQGLTNAQQALEKEQKDWDAKLESAHHKLDGATQALRAKFSNAENTINAAKQRVDSLQTQINSVSQRITDCQHAHWYDLPAKAAIPGLEVEEIALKAAKGIADLALDAANKIIHGVDYLACDKLATLAGNELHDLQVESDAAIKKLEDGLELAKKGIKALDGTLDGIVDRIGKAASVGIDLCKKAFDEAQKAVTAAEQAVNSVEATLETCAEFSEYATAEALLQAAKATGSAALTIAKAGVEVGNAVDQELLKVWDSILQDMEKLVDVTDVVISGELGKAVEDGFAFDAEVKGTLGGDNFFHFSIKYDHNQVEAFFKSLFDELVKLVEQGFLHLGKEIVRVTEGGSMAVKYGPNGTYTIEHA